METKLRATLKDLTAENPSQTETSQQICTAFHMSVVYGTEVSAARDFQTDCNYDKL